ncbi:MAG: T9SS type A sorting domain-containing protein [Crocinitomicaceae bacterium]|nr:T9SS type A sorting domain-containing protein [Crocinitomicaceae bacterium]
MKTMWISKLLTISLCLFFGQVFSQLSISINGTSQSICTGGSVTLTAVPSSAGGTFSWSPGNASSQSIVVSPSSTTTYTVNYTLFGTTVSANYQVQVNVTPTVTITSNVPGNAICNGQTICLTASSGSPGSQFSWSNGVQSSTICVSPTQNITYNVSCMAPNGCSSASSLPVQVSMAPIIQTGDYQICQGDSVALTANVFPNGGSFLWSTGAGSQSIYVNPLSTQLYYVTYTTNGCPSIVDSVLVTVGQNPTVFVPGYNVCVGNSQQIFAVVDMLGGTYSWSNQATSSSIIVTPTNSALMWLAYQAPNGCVAIDSFQVSVLPSPNASIVLDGTVLQALPDSNVYSYQWFDCTAQQPIIGSVSSTLPVNNGFYSVIVGIGQCVDTSVCLEISNAVIHEPNQSVSFYPNPASDFIVLEGFSFQEVSLYSLDGLLINSFIIDSESISLDIISLKPGMYLIKSAEGRFIFNKL